MLYDGDEKTTGFDRSEAPDGRKVLPSRDVSRWSLKPVHRLGVR